MGLSFHIAYSFTFHICVQQNRHKETDYIRPRVAYVIQIVTASVGRYTVNMERTFILLGSLVMFLGVGAGAFGAHALSAYFDQYPKYAGTFDTAVRYQLIHGLALFAIAWASGRFPGSLTTWSGGLIFAGILIFSGSLYTLVLTRQSWLGAITPIGGVAFLAGWACLFIAALRN